MTNVVVKITESLQHLGASTVYGAPVQVGGEEILPVTYVQYGFGGGGTVDGEGGGGGGGFAIPVGVYRRNDAGKPTFRPNILSLLVAVTPLVWVTGRAVSRVIKASHQ